MTIALARPSEAGAKPATETIVLLHGIGSRAGAWKAVQNLMGPQIRTIALDLPGFNGSPLGDVVPTVDGFADAVERWIREQDLGPVAIAGFSLGGAIALELGRRGHATRVVAFAPIGFWGRPGAWWCKSVVIAVHQAAPLTQSFLPLVLRWAWGRRLMLGIFYGQPAKVSSCQALADFAAFRDAQVLPSTARAMSLHRVDSNLPRNLQVTIVWGSRDRVLPARTQARRARRSLPQARHLYLDGCGHVPFSDDPQSCRLALLPRPTRR